MEVICHFSDFPRFCCGLLSHLGSPAERLAALKGAIDEELNSVQANLRNTFMNKIPSAEDIKQACNIFAARFMMNESSKNECKLALVDLLDEALQGMFLC